jgi:hypothetical protein
MINILWNDLFVAREKACLDYERKDNAQFIRLFFSFIRIEAN